MARNGEHRGWPAGTPRGPQSEAHRAALAAARDLRNSWGEVMNIWQEATDNDPGLASEMAIAYRDARNAARADEEDEDQAAYRAEFRAQFGTSDQIFALGARIRAGQTCEAHGKFRCHECKETRGWGITQPSAPVDAGPDLTEEQYAQIGREMISGLPWVLTDEEVEQFIASLNAASRGSVAKPEPPSHKRSSGAF